MKIVFQRISNGCIIVNGEKQSQVGVGVLVFVGFHKNDKIDDIEWVVRKTLSICLWPSSNAGPWRQGVKDLNGEIVFVVEPGLIASTDHSDKPSFDDLMDSEKTKEMFQQLIEKTKCSYVSERVHFAPLGEKIQLDFLNHGPVTFTIDSFHRRE